MSDKKNDMNFAEQELLETSQNVSVEKKPSAPKKKKSLNYFHSTKFKKGGLATAFTIGFVVIVILINIMFSMLENRFPSLQIDLTENKMFSLSEEATYAAERVDIPTTIYILASEESAKDDSLLAGYNLQYSQVAVLAERAAAINSNITVEYVDIEQNPTFASAEKYSSYSLTTGSVIVENDRRIRVLGMEDFYSYEYDDYYNITYYMQVDGALANALLQVTADTIPIVSIASGSHNEILNSSTLSTFTTLLSSNNFEVKTFDLLTDEIPEGTSIVMLPTPTTDYTAEELGKLDAFLDETKEGDRSLWVTMHTTQPDLPNLSSFLSEWGLASPSQVVKDEDTSNLVAPDYSYLISNIASDLDICSDNEYGYFVTPQTRPVERLFTSNDSIVTYPLAQTSETAYLESATGSSSNTSDPGVQTVAALGLKMKKINGNYYDKSVAVFGSSAAFTSSYLSSNTFSNAKYFVDLAKFTSGTSDASVSIMTSQIKTTNYDITVTTKTRDFLGLGVFTIAIPLALIVAGVLVFLKRRHL